MTTLQIANYSQIVANNKPYVVNDRPSDSGVFTASKVKPSSIIIPPLNADINFTAVLPTLTANQYPGFRGIEEKEIPENFNWRENGDPQKRANITKPPNQMLCGSCWAVASSTIISDNFVVSGITKGNPELSTTYILACPETAQNQCKGGNPALLMKTLGSGKELVTKHCIDYSWCGSNNVCNGSAKGHFKAESMNISQLIPPCGCYTDIDHYLYFIKDTSKTVNATSDDDLKVIKHHIMNTGPALAGFIVFKNFMNGNFAKNKSQEGVYIESGEYTTPENFTIGDPSQTTASNFIGSHAISILGWGITKNEIVTGKDSSGKITKSRVPYWYCRNSWNSEGRPAWGDGGYFKIAMYPFNKASVMERVVTVNGAQSGGIVLIDPKDFTKSTKLPTLNSAYLKNITEPKSYYESDPGPKVLKGEGGPSKKAKIAIGIVIAILIVAIIVGVVLGVVFRKKKK